MDILSKLRGLFSKFGRTKKREVKEGPTSEIEKYKIPSKSTPSITDKLAELEREKEEIIQKRSELKARLLQIEEMYESGRLNWATREAQVREILKKLVALRRRLNRIMRELNEINLSVSS
ncbi:MAG: hypothetical protein ACP6IS_02800 [Candidatus Asgardarchaeia archaeon]